MNKKKNSKCRDEKEAEISEWKDCQGCYFLPDAVSSTEKLVYSPADNPYIPPPL